MEIEKYSYLWNEKKMNYVLVKSDSGYGIVDKKERSMLLICDDELEEKIIVKMLESGNKVYDSIDQAYRDTNP